MGLCQEHRGEYLDMKYITKGRVTLIDELPLIEPRIPITTISSTSVKP